MGIKAIDYENLKEGDLVTWYGVHVLQWEREIRPYGIEPTIAFVQYDSVEEINTDLLEALKSSLGAESSKDCYADHHGYCQGHRLEPINDCWVIKCEQAIAKAEGND